eukprot:EG_transcript_66826
MGKCAPPSHLHRTVCTPSSATPQAKKKRRADVESDPGDGPAAARAQQLQFDDASVSSPDGDLTPDQAQVLAYVLGGHSVFFSGSAGTGKTFLLNRIVAA